MMLEGRSIGLIEDDPIMGESLVQALELEGARVGWWQTGAEAQQEIPAMSPEIVICDIRLPDCHGGELFTEVSTRQILPTFLFMTAYGDVEEAVQLIRAGAGDYVTKPFELPNLLERVASLLPCQDDVLAQASLGVSPAMQRVEALLRRAANHSIFVLLTGPTGCGKEVAASFLHEVSDRAAAPFVAVNCAALPTELMESELFGHERGAFTGAHAQHRGLAERAGDGILFLDEIGELAAQLQAKLLRVLEQRVFVRVGGEKEIPFEARVVCASNRDLNEAVRSGEFRQDLLHRINAIEVQIPPLRERADDIQPLMQKFLAAFSQGSDRTLLGFASSSIEMAMVHDWPGNVRELRNRVERAVALSSGEWIMPGDLFPDIVPSQAPSLSPPGQFTKLADARASAERRHIERALREANGSPQNAATLLGVSRTTLWEKMKRLSIEAGTDRDG